MLAVVVANISRDGITFERARFANHEADIAALRQWSREMSVTEVVMESTAQYWKTLWLELEEEFRVFLAQPMSNRRVRASRQVTARPKATSVCARSWRNAPMPP
jgi:hypothetical protein